MTAPKRPQDRRPKKAAAPKPSARVAFDLNALEREVDEVLPFTFQHGEGEFELPDPMTIDFADLVGVSNDPLANVSLLARILGNDQYRELRKQGPLEQWKIPHLLNAWYAHYGIDPDELGKSDD